MQREPDPEDMRDAIGLDIGGRSVKAVLLVDGEVRALAQSAAYERPDRGTLDAALDHVLSRVQPTSDGPIPVGVSTPGILAGDGHTVALSVNLPGLNDLHLGKAVRDRVGRVASTRVVSDAFAAAFGYWCMEKPAGRMLCLALGTGVGAALLDDGEQVMVTGNTPGHLGQLDVGRCDAARDHVGPDGGVNTLEAFVGANALHARFGETPAQSLVGASDSDPAWQALARAIRIAHAVYRPHHVVLMGGIGIRLAPAISKLDRLVREGLTGVAREAHTLTAATSDRLGAIGAARCAVV